ncbi:tyrosine-protein phosphatase [Rhodococcus kroppenstedtii]|uniref:tyrosine-protein phosphatase n=1 Tax=Rhodococcoides kroppenstedtii TaxID=293050 RepID=UPI001C9B69A1|nr:tyrosine-protein phosphatase [Rhodococcus kroppenstedtii]MBY6438418.1 tyrosine-protein phosphatase [Rhodococcus kroppenstedtii]
MTETAADLLDGAWNVRDIGGLRTDDGGTTRPGVLVRSSELTRLTDSGRAALDRLGVRDVFDFRGRPEVERFGSDRTPPSVRVHAVPFVDAVVVEPDTGPAPAESTAAPAESAAAPAESDSAPHEPDRRVTDARGYLLDTYRAFPTRPGARVAVGSVLRTIAAGEGTVLVHCAAGKDRAGWTVATVLRAAGVTDSDILADYLRSNDAVSALRDHVLSHGVPPEHIADDLLGVREEYLRAGLDAVDAAHGSFDNYLDWLGADADLLAALRRTLIAQRPV